jgi:Ca2+-binding EF-hand superfamily protein
MESKVVLVAMLLATLSSASIQSGRTTPPAGEIKLDFNLDEAMVRKFDRNKDGALNLGEFQDIMEAQLRKAAAANPNNKVKIKDADLVKFRAGLREPFKVFDKNANGLITLAEMNQALQSKK